VPFVLGAASGCHFPRDVGSDPNRGQRGVLLFDVASSEATLDHYGVVGVPWRVGVSRYEAQSVACNAKNCDSPNRTPLELVEARCAQGRCTVEGLDAQGTDVALAVLGSSEGSDTLIVRARRRDTGEILSDETKISFRGAARLSVEVDSRKDAGIAQLALLPGAKTLLCPDLLDDSGRKMTYTHPKASAVLSLESNAVRIEGDEARYQSWCLVVVAERPGRASFRAQLGTLTRTFELRVVAETEVDGLELRRMTRAQEGDVAALLDVDAPLPATPVVEVPVNATSLGDYVAVLPLKNGGEAVARFDQLALRPGPGPVRLSQYVEPWRTVFTMIADRPGTAVLTATVGDRVFSHEVVAVERAQPGR
jgi:hypothetical protein